MANSLTYNDQKIPVGSTIAVTQRIIESGKERQQIFEGILIKIKNSEDRKTFTVRKIAANQIGVEKIWPVNSPGIIDIKLKRKAKIQRAKLYYLRDRIGRQATKIEAKK
jgi:large subunit ribosomal protein L19